MASYRKRGCKCPKDQKKCTCGATWEFRLSVIDPNTGKRIYPQGSDFKTRQLAVEAATKLHAEILKGNYIKDTDFLFKELAQEFIKTYSSPTNKKKLNSIDIRTVDIKRLNVVLGERKVKDITERNYQFALNKLKSLKPSKIDGQEFENYSDSTMISTHATAKLIFDYAVSLGELSKNPATNAIIPFDPVTVESLEEEEEIPSYLEKEELALFLDYTYKSYPYRVYAIFHIMAYTGLRIGELHALKISDINLDNKIISVTKTLYCRRKVNGTYIPGTPKTKSSKRKIEIDAITTSVIENLISDVLRFKETSHNYDDKNFLIVNRNSLPGQPISPRSTNKIMKTILKGCGLSKNFSSHILRHTHVSLLAEAGTDLELIQKRMGHKNDNITKLIYLHITKPLRREAADNFSDLMNSVRKSTPDGHNMGKVTNQVECALM